MSIRELIEKANLKIEKSKILYDEPMDKHTTFKIGGPADCFIKIDNINDLREILLLAKRNNIPITVLGNGSNVLVRDKGIRGIVLSIRIEKIEMMNMGNQIYAVVGAGIKMIVLAHLLLRNSIQGFEELSGIPGTVGGAIRMNAGAHGKEMKDIVDSVKCMDYDGNIIELKNRDMEFDYRKSILKNKKYNLLEKNEKLKKKNKKEIKEKKKK